MTDYTYEKELMAYLLLTINDFHNAEMEYHGKFEYTIVHIQHIAIISIIDICYTSCCLSNHTMAPNLPGFKGIKLCIKHLSSKPPKHIFYPSNSYDGLNVIRLTWSGNQVEEYKTQNCL